MVRQDEGFDPIPIRFRRFQPQHEFEGLLHHTLPAIGGRDRPFEIGAGSETVLDGRVANFLGHTARRTGNANEKEISQFTLSTKDKVKAQGNIF